MLEGEEVVVEYHLLKQRLLIRKLRSRFLLIQERSERSELPLPQFCLGGVEAVIELGLEGLSLWLENSSLFGS
jgi:hypothetical protein